MTLKEKLGKNPLVAVILTVFVDLVGFGILIPIIPLLLADPSSEFFMLPSSMSLDQGYIILGLMIGIYGLMTFISAPILGQLSDKYGRKKLLIISLIGTAIGYLFFAYGIIIKNIPLLFIARAIDGITGGNISIAQAAIADVSKPKDRAKNFGLMGAAFGIGFILGPFIGGKLSDPTLSPYFHPTTPFYFAAILTAINIMSVIIFLPETLKEKKDNGPIKLNKSITNIIKAFSIKGLRALFASIFLYSSGFTFFTSFFSVFLITKFHYTQSNIGDFFAYLGVWIALTQAVLTRWASTKFEEHDIVMVSLFGMSLVLPLYFLPKVHWQIFLIAPFFSIFNGLTQANITALVSGSVDSTIQGEILGINASLRALAQAIPPMLSGFVAAKLSHESPIVIASITIFISAVIFAKFFRPSRLLKKSHMAE